MTSKPLNKVPSTCVCTIALCSLVLRPHFIMRENSLVSKVEFLGPSVVYAFPISVTNIENIVPHPLLRGKFLFTRGSATHTEKMLLAHTTFWE